MDQLNTQQLFLQFLSSITTFFNELNEYASQFNVQLNEYLFSTIAF